MNLDEFSFFNRQLAAMVDGGIPLEGALRKLCAGMKRSTLRHELELLEADLERGLSLKEALKPRKLPELYIRMLTAGHRSGNLTSLLTLLADHYQRTHNVWTRLKGVMVYPTIVLLLTFAVSLLLASLCVPMSSALYGSVNSLWYGSPSHNLLSTQILIVLPCVLLGAALSLLLLLAIIPAFRRHAVWRLPAFKEASLARLASCIELSLESGCTFNEALATARVLEGASPVGKELQMWERRLSEGSKRLSDIGEGSRWIPPLFLWLVDSCGEDWANGFRQARTIYSGRATARTEMFLYAALPISILALASLIAMQLLPMVRHLSELLRYM